MWYKEKDTVLRLEKDQQSCGRITQGYRSPFPKEEAEQAASIVQRLLGKTVVTTGFN